MGWNHEAFDIPKDIYSEWDASDQGQAIEDEWNEIFTDYKSKNPALAEEFSRRMTSDLPDGIEEAIYKYIEDVQKEEPNIATRTSSQRVINVLGPLIPELVGGSADLTGSNNTNWEGTHEIKYGDFSGIDIAPLISLVLKNSANLKELIILL